jgi:hypothetical protein
MGKVLAVQVFDQSQAQSVTVRSVFLDSFDRLDSRHAVSTPSAFAADELPRLADVSDPDRLQLPMLQD